MRITCTKCGIFMGDIETGALRKGRVILCMPCYADLQRLAGARVNDALRDDMPEFLRDMLDGKVTNDSR